MSFPLFLMLNIYYSLNRRDANRQENLKILITFTVAMLYLCIYNFSGVRVISFVKVTLISLSMIIFMQLQE